MREALTDLVRQVAPLFEKVRVTGTEDGVKVESFTADKMLFLVANMKPIPEVTGEFGIGSLSLLKNLLDFPTYKGEGSSLVVHRTTRDDLEYPSELEFRAKNGSTTLFKTMNPRLTDKQAKIAQIPWTVVIQPSKATIAEVTQMTNMMSEVDKHFRAYTKDGTLFLHIGGSGAASHGAHIALAADVEGELPENNRVFKAPQFLAVLKNAGNNAVTVKFSTEGIGGITIETPFGEYSFYLRTTEN